MPIRPYNRADAVAYAEKWAMSRNPAYYNFDNLGGDCTNFISQCLYAGAGVMNYTPNTGWYYRNLSDRAPAWTSVQYLYQFLTTNTGPGPFARSVNRNALRPGDVIQLGDISRFYHSLLVLGASSGQIYVAAHSYDALWRPLDSYSFAKIRFLHIEGVRTRH